ncbi:hypothetical protein HPB52_021618 [Rhipicephalus sanguineus]|uniref:Uncharacterized protein n=1 Tax=Rhipicephalus sanguineus TaxID=34632 RepID=A0A9D4Q393_RHISA|nr:hypothetical protein HPB52_021618 [Rhipicephalus sanguineus]
MSAVIVDFETPSSWPAIEFPAIREFPDPGGAVAIGEPPFAAGRRDGIKAAASFCGDKVEREDARLFFMYQEVHG